MATIIEVLTAKKREKVEEITEEIFTETQKNLVKPMPFEKGKRNLPPSVITDTGSILKSGRVEHSSEVSKVIYDSPVALHIEYGTEPHTPPIGPLKRWARRKLGKSEKDAERIAWAIRNTIKKFGSDPHPFIRPAVKTVVQRHRQALLIK